MCELPHISAQACIENVLMAGTCATCRIWFLILLILLKYICRQNHQNFAYDRGGIYFTCSDLLSIDLIKKINTRMMRLIFNLGHE